MTIRDLEIFAEVCRHMNMSKAAQELFISQSSVSQAIAALEEEYQTRLFERLSKKLYLTPGGDTLLFYTNQLLDNLEQMKDKMKNADHRQLLRIGACTTIGYYLIHPMIDEYQVMCPQVHTIVQIGNSSELEKELLASRLDIAIVQGTPNTKELTYTAMLDDELFLTCASDHPLAGQRVAIESLAGESLVGREKGSGTRSLLESAFLEADISLETRWSCGNADAIKQAVRQKRGIALLSQLVIGEELAKGELAVISLRGHRFTRKFYAACHKDKYQTGAMRGFMELCEKTGGREAPFGHEWREI